MGPEVPKKRTADIMSQGKRSSRIAKRSSTSQVFSEGLCLLLPTSKLTGYRGFCHLENVKREMMVGYFGREAKHWTFETFTAIAAFDDKDRFEVLVAKGVNRSRVESDVVPFKIGCVQGHQDKFLQGHSPTVGAVKISCVYETRARYSTDLILSKKLMSMYHLVHFAFCFSPVQTSK